MAHYILNASKDATIYSQYPNNNSGLYSVLEISKVRTHDTNYVSRVLLKFDIQDALTFITNRGYFVSGSVLRLNETESYEIPLEYDILVNPISGSWDMGIGRHLDVVSTQGVSWNNRGNSGWSYVDNGDASAATTVDGSGGVWYSVPSSHQHFQYQTTDINMDVFNIVSNWISGSIPNNGFILRYSSSIETDNYSAGSIKFFSKETHTIYQPKLHLMWDDRVFVTGSLTPITEPFQNLTVLCTNLMREYKVNTTTRFNIVTRTLNTLKTFSNQYPFFGSTSFLPQNVYYSVVDTATNLEIIPYSVFSSLSCNETGNYIDINFYNWEPNRSYTVNIRYISSTEAIDIGSFKFRLV